MANFEALIKNALASQDASSPEVRDAVYQSSRNALKRILDSNRSLTVEAAISQQDALEQCIVRVEQEYAPPQDAQLTEDNFFVDENDPLYDIQQILTGGKARPVQQTEAEPAVAPEPTPEPVQQVEVQPQFVSEPVQQAPELSAQPEVPFEAPQQEQAAVTQPNTNAQVPTSEPQIFVESQQSQIQHDYKENSDQPVLTEEDYSEGGHLTTGFVKRRKKQKIGLWIIVVIAILAALGWIGFKIFTGLQDGSLIGFDAEGNKSPNAISNSVDAKDYITILKPSDLSSLIIAGRGTASLVNQQNTQMIRMKSVRSANNRTLPAEPILVRIKPGVLERISGKRLTVEIYAKSTSNNQAQFLIQCDFANGTDCGRKRFVTGVQPQASIFEIDFANVSNVNADYFIAIKTDTTSSADVSGEGDELDIVYIRFKVAE